MKIKIKATGSFEKKEHKPISEVLLSGNTPQAGEEWFINQLETIRIASIKEGNANHYAITLVNGAVFFVRGGHKTIWVKTTQVVDI